jgi:hypothetical protein
MSRKRWKKQKVNSDRKDKEKNDEDDAMMPGGGPGFNTFSLQFKSRKFEQKQRNIVKHSLKSF